MATLSNRDPVGIFSQDQSFLKLQQILDGVDVMAVPPKSLLLAWVVAEFISLSGWGHLQQARGWSQLPFDHTIRVNSPSPVVRAKASSPAESYLERQSQLSQGQRRAEQSFCVLNGRLR